MGNMNEFLNRVNDDVRNFIDFFSELDLELSEVVITKD